MQRWTKQFDPSTFINEDVRAVRRIEQNPAAKAPAVPRGSVGYIADWIQADGLFAVDFDEPYGVVLVYSDEITLVKGDPVRFSFSRFI